MERTTKARIQAVLTQHPDLSYWGWRGGQTDEQLAENRAYFLTDDAVKQVEACLAYLAPIRQTKRARWCSYGVKHWVEAWLLAKGHSDRQSYICNGALIVAALIGGCTVRRIAGSMSCLIGLHGKDVR